MNARHSSLTVLTVLLLAGCMGSKSDPQHESVAANALDSQQTINTPKLLISPTPTELKSATEKADASPPEVLTNNLKVRNWASELLVADPIAIDIDEQGRIYYSRTIRQKNSEFDIRSHRDWESGSVSLDTVEGKREFLKTVLAPVKSKENTWLEDLNGDGSHDWKDLKIEKEQVYRVEDTNHDGIADSSLLVVEDFNDEITDVAGALLKEGDHLYVGVAPDMWQLSDSDGDGVMDSKLSMAHGFGVHVGFSGHGMSGAETGPDGRIYWGIGDIGFNGKGNDTDGSMVDYSDRGVIVRSNPDGTDFEVFAMGVRNTHEFAFDKFGNLISVDNDGDHPGESERIVYLTEGSDSGWRINWQLGKYRDPQNNSYKVWMDEGMYLPRFEGQAAHITPPIVNYVNGPTGMVYNPGTALVEKWQDAFFVAEFAGDPSRSGVHAFHLKPEGAGFNLQDTEKLLSGVLATGMEFGPDGALYIADWIDGWKTNNQGRIWKLDNPDESHSQIRQDISNLLKENFNSIGSHALAKHLANPDMRIRQKAQFALVENKTDAAEIFKNTLNTSTNQLARIHSIWGLSQLARKNREQALLLIPLLSDTDPEIRAQAARWLGDLRYEKAAENILPLLEDTSLRVNFFAAEALGRMAYAPAAEKIISLLRKNQGKDRYIHHAGSLALARLASGELLGNLAKDESEAVRSAAVVALRRIQDPRVVNFLHDNSDWVIADAARAINDDASIPDALPTLGNLLLSYNGDNEVIIRRAISANLRLATPATLKNLLDFIEKETASIAMRDEAIAALSTWAKPSVFDRVDGKYRGHVERDAELPRTNARPILSALLQHQNAQIREASAKALGKLKIVSARDTLFATLRNDKRSQVRVAALNALANLGDTHLGEIITIALNDQSTTVRATAFNLLKQSNLDEESIASLLSNVLDNGEIAEKQSAFVTLSKLNINKSHSAFIKAINQLSQNQLAEGVVLDLIETVKSTNDKDLLEKLDKALDQYANNDLQRKYPGLLAGGNPDSGRYIFLWHQSAHCVKCHTIKEGIVKTGPYLGNISSILSEEQILQALVDPSARISPGFGKGPSSMPNMSYFLTQREIRDVISFLGTLKNQD